MDFQTDYFRFLMIPEPFGCQSGVIDLRFRVFGAFSVLPMSLTVAFADPIIVAGDTGVDPVSITKTRAAYVRPPPRFDVFSAYAATGKAGPWCVCR